MIVTTDPIGQYSYLMCLAILTKLSPYNGHIARSYDHVQLHSCYINHSYNAENWKISQLCPLNVQLNQDCHIATCGEYHCVNV